VSELANEPRSEPVVSASGNVVENIPGRAELDPASTARRRAVVEVGLAVAVPAALILWWQLASDWHYLDPRTHPSPTTIFSAGWNLATEGDLWSDTFVTMRRVILGWFVGGSSGIVLGLVMGANRLLRKALEPTLDALYVVPKLALLPVLLTIFGLGEGPKVALVAITVFFFVWISTMTAVMSVAEGYRETGQAFGATQGQMFRHVLVPAALPQVMVGLRVGSGVAVLVIVAAEYIVGTDGLGYVIFNAHSLGLNDEMYVGIVVVAVFGVLFAELIRQVGRRLVPWAPEDRAAGRT
jgi:ABC-type nitrate/sulfonate/bicarbonate transport system permease component